MKMRYSQEQKNPLREECVAYFQGHRILHRLLEGFREKYRSYGSFSGTVVLRNLKTEDIETLEGFFQRSYHGQKSVSISAERFVKALQESRFHEIAPMELLDAYFEEKLIGKKEQKLEEQKQWNQIFENYKERNEGTPANEWIVSLCLVFFGVECEALYSKEQAFSENLLRISQRICSYLKKSYHDAGQIMESVEQILSLGCKILNGLPYRTQSKEYLAVFAAKITGNPHAFDEGEGGWLLNELVQWELELCAINYEIPSNSLVDSSTNPLKIISGDRDVFSSIQKQKKYLLVGILRDDISNYAIVSGIRAWKEDGTIHAGTEGFFVEGDMMQIPLSVIVSWKAVECPQNEIYIVENPSIYAMLCGKWRGKKACMCMNGQPRLSSLLLLDLLAKAGTKVYYAGDFDPEGLLIAQKLKQYYQGEFTYWHMTTEVYLESLSKKEISETSLKQLEHITDGDLESITKLMRECKLAGYQENVWERYLGG